VRLELQPTTDPDDYAFVHRVRVRFAGQLVDGFLLVVRHRLTPRDAIQQGLAKVRVDRVLGVVMNDYREILPSYTSYAYRRYGMAYGPSKRAKDPSAGSKE
jgi:Mrp family chromosome partitioning ATPase